MSSQIFNKNSPILWGLTILILGALFLRSSLKDIKKEKTRVTDELAKETKGYFLSFFVQAIFGVYASTSSIFKEGPPVITPLIFIAIGAFMIIMGIIQLK